MQIEISIIIPTHNRATLISRTLNALEKQSFPMHQFEVIIVADGCTDKTIDVLNQYKAPFILKVVEQEGQGPAVARNHGAMKAAGQVLIFIDDDIEVSPGFIQAHIDAHDKKESQVVIGYSPPILKNQTGFFRIILKEWWENMFLKMSKRDHRFSYRDLLSGNFSLSAVLFNSVGGFNTGFKCQEDYEIGLRLIKANADFNYAPMAIGYHHEMTDLNRSFQRKFAEGKAAILFSSTYPEIIHTLPLLQHFYKGYSAYYKGLLVMIYKWGFLAHTLAAGFKGLLYLLEFLRMRKYWRLVLMKLLGYWYLKGIAEATGNLKTLSTLIRANTINNTSEIQELILDIENGLIQAETKVDELRPNSIRVLYGDQSVGSISLMAGYERLRGIHLKSFLANNSAYLLMQAIAVRETIKKTDEDFLTINVNKKLYAN